MRLAGRCRRRAACSGSAFPWLIKSEALHYGYALVMLVGLWLLRSGFTGVKDHWWWTLRPRHPVLPSLRAPAPADAGAHRAQPLRPAGADQHRAALGAASRAAPVLQHHRVHPDGDRDVLPPVPAVAGERRPQCTCAWHERTPSAALRPAPAAPEQSMALAVRCCLVAACRAGCACGRSPAPPRHSGMSPGRLRLDGAAAVGTDTLDGHAAQIAPVHPVRGATSTARRPHVPPRYGASDRPSHRARDGRLRRAVCVLDERRMGRHREGALPDGRRFERRIDMARVRRRGEAHASPGTLDVPATRPARLAPSTVTSSAGRLSARCFAGDTLRTAAQLVLLACRGDRRPSRPLRSAARADEPRHGPHLGALPRAAHRRAARGRQSVLRRLSVRARARPRAPAASRRRGAGRGGFAASGLASRSSSRCCSPTSCSICGRCRAAPPGWSSGISPPRWPSISSSPAPRSASTSARSASSTSSRRRCRRSSCGFASSPRSVVRADGGLHQRPARRRRAASIVQRGCELGLFLPTKVGNLDCTFCLDCVQACPHDNIAIAIQGAGRRADRDRPPFGDRPAGPPAGHRGAGGGVHVRRTAERVRDGVPGLRDRAVARGMQSAHASEAPGAWRWCSSRRSDPAPARPHRWRRGGHAPAGLCTGARAWHESPCATPTRWCRSASAMWLAHYGFHFLTGVWTVVPVTQSAALDAFGRALLGEPFWRWLGMRPGAVFPIQLGFILLGTFGSLVLVAPHLRARSSRAATRAAAPWVVVVVATRGAGAVDSVRSRWRCAGRGSADDSSRSAE